MKIQLRRDGEVNTAKLPHPHSQYVVVLGACPHCNDPDFKVAGVVGTTRRGYDTYTSTAACAHCLEVVGKLVVTVNTIFGIEEDDRVLNGRCRVY